MSSLQDMAHVRMSYGNETVDIDVPDSRVLAVADIKETKRTNDERVELETALDNPIGHRGIQGLATKGKRSVIVVDDNTRPTPVRKILPIVLDRLNYAGIKDRDIHVLVALGTHRPMTDNELREKIGKELLQRVSVTNHYWKQKEMLADMGKTESGVPLSVNRKYLEADIKIGIGHIAPHSQAGWTGGAKIVQPGVCGAETTDYTHWLSARFDLRNLLGVANNPVRLEIENVVRRIGLDFILNVVLNSQKELVKAVSGDFVAAHRAGVREAEKIFRIRIPSLADIVVCDSYPSSYGIDFWQASKAIMSSYLAVKRGGTIILFAPCPDGVSPEHTELAQFGHRPYEEVKKLIERGVMRDLNAAAASAQIGQILADKVKVVLYSEGISQDETRRLGFEYADSPQGVVDSALEKYGTESKILFLRNACEMLPNLSP
jgi:nickel-dependent lactate racemase